MPFRDEVSFLVLPPGATPPIVGQPIIVLNPGPPGDPRIELYTGDADELLPAIIASGTNPDGTLVLALQAPTHQFDADIGYINIGSVRDGVINSDTIEIGANEIRLINLDYTLTIDRTTFDIDGQLIFDVANSTLQLVGADATIRGNPVLTRNATDVDTASSGNINTTETIIQTITGAVVSGQTYKLTADFGYAVSDVTFIGFARIREDNASGTVLQARRINAPTTASPWSYHMEAEFTAGSTGNKTIVLTLQRTAGAGNIVLAAGATQPSYFYMDYVRG